MSRNPTSTATIVETSTTEMNESEQADHVMKDRVPPFESPPVRNDRGKYLT